jgi:hypothetical protein
VSGYEGYPQCAPIPESSDSSARCSAQLLPRHLDTVAHLGYNDEVRLQGYFYIDIAHQYVSLYAHHQWPLHVVPPNGGHHGDCLMWRG